MKERPISHAVMQAAEVLCNCDYTDGFCSPRHNPDCRCIRMARTVVEAIEHRTPPSVWGAGLAVMVDPKRPPEDVFRAMLFAEPPPEVK